MRTFYGYDFRRGIRPYSFEDSNTPPRAGWEYGLISDGFAVTNPSRVLTACWFDMARDTSGE